MIVLDHDSFRTYAMCNELRYYKSLLLGEMLIFTKVCVRSEAIYRLRKFLRIILHFREKVKFIFQSQGYLVLRIVS